MHSDDLTDHWGTKEDKAFTDAKHSVISAVTLAHPNPTDDVEIWADVADRGMGAVAVQRTESGWRPIGFWSKKLNSAQKMYSTFDKEMMAVSGAISHFRDLVEGRTSSNRANGSSAVSRRGHPKN